MRFFTLWNEYILLFEIIFIINKWFYEFKTVCKKIKIYMFFFIILITWRIKNTRKLMLFKLWGNWTDIIFLFCKQIYTLILIQIWYELSLFLLKEKKSTWNRLLMKKRNRTGSFGRNLKKIFGWFNGVIKDLHVDCRVLLCHTW